MFVYRSAIGAFAGTAAVLLTLAGAAAFDETKYPDWSGTWRRAPGASIGWDEYEARRPRPAAAASPPNIGRSGRPAWPTRMPAGRAATPASPA